jgi:hypothetical protein
MKKLIFTVVLFFLLTGCKEDDGIYHILDVNYNRFSTTKYTRIPGGIKFYDLGWGDTVELYGSFYIRVPLKEIKDQKFKTINHNDYSK